MERIVPISEWDFVAPRLGAATEQWGKCPDCIRRHSCGDCPARSILSFGGIARRVYHRWWYFDLDPKLL